MDSPEAAAALKEFTKDYPLAPGYRTKPMVEQFMQKNAQMPETAVRQYVWHWSRCTWEQTWLDARAENGRKAETAAASMLASFPDRSHRPVPLYGLRHQQLRRRRAARAGRHRRPRLRRPGRRGQLRAGRRQVKDVDTRRRVEDLYRDHGRQLLGYLARTQQRRRGRRSDGRRVRGGVASTQAPPRTWGGEAVGLWYRPQRPAQPPTRAATPTPPRDPTACRQHPGSDAHPDPGRARPPSCSRAARSARPGNHRPELLGRLQLRRGRSPAPPAGAHHPHPLPSRPPGPTRVPPTRRTPSRNRPSTVLHRSQRPCP